MNWMTSGKHRALYSQRGRRRQMHFPSQVQRQRVKPTSPSRSSEPRARDSAKPWYIVSIGDDDESQDIRVLELERKGAISATESEAEEKARKISRVGERGDARAPSGPSQKRGREQEQRDQGGRSDNRCIFTPVKKARKYEQPSRPAQLVKNAREKRPPSSIASGVEMLFFNDGEELPHKNRAQSRKRVASEPVLYDTHSRKFPQRIGDARDEKELQHPRRIFQDGNFDSHCGELEDQQQASDSDNTSSHGLQAFTDSVSEADQRDIQLWKVNSRSCAGSSPDMAFSRPDTASFEHPRDPIHETFLATPPPSPFVASPLSFKMSRAEVLQSQPSARFSCTTHNQMSFPPSPRSSPSPSPSSSTSTSSQGSIVLGRPPLGWQKNLLLALEENSRDRPEYHFGKPASSRVNDSPMNLADSKVENVRLDSPPSPNSSRGSDSPTSITDAIIPVDAKERIMASTASQHVPELSRSWYPRPITTKSGNTNGTNTVVSGKSAVFQQSWVMSSRTKIILDAVSPSKAISMEKAIQKSETKQMEMESVAIYMYTLVQCYKIDEKLRFVNFYGIIQRPASENHTYYIVISTDNGSSPIAGLAQLPSEDPSTPTTTALTKQQTASQREIIFSPKRAR
ncbi:hypothetical protein L914_07925 [Phytophthora nicotianae]|uniref:Uncharacterized protein n=1 Tax=Phytophthora nicotianae TaxID=4792 RepID=W2NHF6_PHYNI|nr:hypothetical protein L914_07925 [Phytophthora nicotianae]